MSLRNLSITLTPECQTQLTDWFAHSFSPEEIVRNLEVMYETCRSHSAAVVGVTVPKHKMLIENNPGQDSFADLMRSELDDVNSRLMALVQRKKDSGDLTIQIIDAHSRTLIKAGTEAGTLFSSDGLHFSKSGYQALGVSIFELAGPFLQMNVGQSQQIPNT
eukprot:CAMPEP_0184327806 /NCGR_PEP_ID=MMETSP1049-20130417/143286_1 /TAXON_ID=77928 /ORGANISM="Proteomonas sulcata, Strain CCMP704" /LENGTH=161 /DNA_ID=CAMNT_0026650083 /DNA_START=728 /DNA_END=1213 /DNA_ORIENTATION=+